MRDSSEEDTVGGKLEEDPLEERLMMLVRDGRAQTYNSAHSAPGTMSLHIRYEGNPKQPSVANDSCGDWNTLCQEESGRLGIQHRMM